MVRQVLSTAQTNAQIDAEGACQQKVNAAEAELAERKAAVASASAALEAAQSNVMARKEKLSTSRKQLVWEESEQKRISEEDDAKAAEVRELETGKSE